MLLAVIVLSVAADILLNGGAVSLFLARKLFALVQALEFWRH